MSVGIHYYLLPWSPLMKKERGGTGTAAGGRGGGEGEKCLSSGKLTIFSDNYNVTHGIASQMRI